MRANHWAVTMGLFALLAAPMLPAAQTPLSVDDVLNLRNVGNALARPAADAFVWEQSPPYASFGAYGNGVSATWLGSDYHIWSRQGPSESPRLLFDPVPRTSYRLVSFSPDGRYLLLLAVRDGLTRLAAYDFGSRRVTEFALTPRFSTDTLAPIVEWLGAGRLAVALPSDDVEPIANNFRVGLGRKLSGDWNRSWAGLEPSFDIYTSLAASTSEALPGSTATVDLATGGITRIDSGQISGLHASSDHRWLAMVRDSSLPQTDLTHPRVDWVYARSRLAIVSADLTGRREVEASLDVLQQSITWEPHGDRVAFYGWTSEEGIRRGHFCVYDAASGTLTRLSHDGVGLASQRARGAGQWPEQAQWIGRSIAVYGRSTPGEPGALTYEDIVSGTARDPRVGTSSSAAHWFLLAPSAAPVDLTPSLKVVSPLPLFAGGGRLIVAADGRAWHIGANKPIPVAQGFAGGLAMRPDAAVFSTVLAGGNGYLPIAGSSDRLAHVVTAGRSVALRSMTTLPYSSIMAVSGSSSLLALSGVGKSAALEVLAQGRPPKVIERLNPQLANTAETRWIPFAYQAPKEISRRDLSGCLLLPADYQPGQRRPLIVDIYPDSAGSCSRDGGRESAMASRTEAYSMHLLASRGYIVFRPDTAGGIARSAEGPQARVSTVVDRGIDAVVAAGYADASRVGVIGFSQGGFLALWLATQSTRYRAVVSLNGWSDLTSEFFDMTEVEQYDPVGYGESGGSSRYLSDSGSSFAMGGTPWSIPESYIRNSPLWQADRVSAPVLLIHSDMDSFADAAYRKFFTALYLQKKESKLLIYHGEGHSPSSPANIRHMWTAIYDWFDRHLAPPSP